MTNIMGFKIKNDGPVYLCADSQATVMGNRGPFDKRLRQKLFYQDGTIFVGSGSYEKLLELRKYVQEMSHPSAKDIMERMLKKARKIRIDREDPNENLSVFVAGKEDGQPVLYALNPWGEKVGDKYKDPGYESVNFVVLGGSGQSKTDPAIERDMEMGGISLNDTTEGMALCFSYGERASRDMYVDDKFQIGIIGKDFTRTLYHPAVYMASQPDYYNYFASNFGVNPEGIEVDAKTTLNDLYQALLTTCMHINHLSNAISRCNVMSVSDMKRRAEYEKSRTDTMKDRDAEKGYASELIDAWISGNAGNMEAALKAYAFRRFESYERAGMYFGTSEQLSFDFMKREPEVPKPTLS